MFSDIFEDKPKEIRPKRRIEDPREFLTAVMNEDPAVMNSEHLQQQMRAAIELLPYTHPKLAVVAQVTENDIATLLDRRIKRMEQMKVIEAQPQTQTIDAPKPLPRLNDRRYRRI
jgi:hypothetical protein